MKTNDNKNSGKSNIIFEFDDNRIVKIKSECGRGATCISYTCEITFKDNPKKLSVESLRNLLLKDLIISRSS